ncbi:oxidoreductase-like protein [Xylaria arbuscula]|nr:oxidoreductase-like protein [Xylaria arbuscula]
MPPNMRPLMRVARLQQQSALLSRNPYGRAFISSQGNNTLPGGTPGESSTQAMPIGPYYESMLTDPQPIPKAKPEQPPASSPKAPSSRSTKKAAAAPKPKANEESSSSKSSSGTATSTTTTVNANADANTPAADAGADATASTVPPQPSAEPATAQEKARIIFGSRLAGPAERADRLQSIRNRSTLIAGVLVPPRPEEPDNCCMSGCVNCVWDRYGEELEDWAAASARAEAALAASASQAQTTTMKSRESVMRKGARVSSSAAHSGTAISMDDDGGGSESNWQPEEIVANEKKKEMEMAKTDRPKIAKDLWDDELYSNIPVGIREFMKTEKKLKKKHAEDGTLGG